MLSSRLFVPYRAIGLVAENSPFVTYNIGGEVFIAIPVGKSFQVLKVTDLKVKRTSPPRSRTIRAIAARVVPRNHTKRKLSTSSIEGAFDAWHLTSCGASVLIWKNNSQIGACKGHSSEVTHILDFNGHLLSVASEAQEMYLWCYDVTESEGENIEGDSSMINITEPINTANLPGKVSVIHHPDAYLNKVLIAYENGGVDLWNFRKMSQVFSFFSDEPSYVTAIRQSHVTDVLAFGFADGYILLHNIKKNQEICRFFMDGNSPITSLDFYNVNRSNGDDSMIPLLASSSNLGHIAFWDLKKKKLQSVLMHAHYDSITKLQFLDKDPLLITCGADNSIKIWVFESSDENPRILKERSGHSLPPNKIKFSEDGELLFTAGGDRALRVFSVFKSAQLQEMSQGNLLHAAKTSGRPLQDLKLPVILDFDYSDSKSRFWDALVSIHRDSNLAQTWSVDRKAIGEHSLRLPSSEEITVLFSTWNCFLMYFRRCVSRFVGISSIWVLQKA
jgi:U3 small nucleolar RNA-associated protein 21